MCRWWRGKVGEGESVSVGGEGATKKGRQVARIDTTRKAGGYDMKRLSRGINDRIG